MSAWIVSRAHIDALVNAALPHGDECLRYFHDDTSSEVALEDRHAIGQMLIDECVKSVSYRYPNDIVEAGELPGPTDAYYLEPYRFRFPGLPLSPVTIVKAVHCYRYQSCEHPGWETSKADALARAIEARWVRKVPGYDQAPWGLEDSDVGPTNAILLTDLVGADHDEEDEVNG